MKFLLLIAGVVLFQVIGIQCYMEEFHECLKEAGISEEIFKLGEKASKGKPEFKCIYACTMKKLGQLEAGNKINLDKVKEHMSPGFEDKVDQVIEAHEVCVETVKGKTDECEFANALVECIENKFPDGKKV